MSLDHRQAARAKALWCDALPSVVGGRPLLRGDSGQGPESEILTTLKLSLQAVVDLRGSKSYWTL